MIENKLPCKDCLTLAICKSKLYTRLNEKQLENILCTPKKEIQLDLFQFEAYIFLNILKFNCSLLFDYIQFKKNKKQVNDKYKINTYTDYDLDKYLYIDFLKEFKEL